MSEQKLESYTVGDFGRMPFEFRAAYLLAYKLAESGCPGSNTPSKSVMALFESAYEEFKKHPLPPHDI